MAVYSPQQLGINPPAGGFQTGGWYNGRQYWNGTLGEPGVIHPESNQQGAGQAVSTEVNAQSARAQGVTPQQFESYLQQQREVQPTISQPAVTQPTVTQPVQAPKTPEQITEDIVSATEDYWNRQTSFLEEYTKENPFVFDEELAKLASKEQYEPYYSELLEDYLGDIGVKKETIQDEQKLLEALRTTPEGTAGVTTRAYERAVGQAEEGFAGSGMFFSGIKKRGLGEAEAEREYELKETATGIQRKERDITREQEAAIAGGVETRRGETFKGYYIPLTQAFSRQFPTEGAGALAGYTIPEHFRL